MSAPSSLPSASVSLSRVLYASAAACFLAVVVNGCAGQGAARVVSTSPADGATDVTPGATITMVFDRAASPETLAHDIVPATDATVTWSNGNTVLTVTPGTDLAVETSYTMTITSLMFADGAALFSPYVFSFTTASGAPQANLADVRYWAYQIQGLENDAAVDALVESRYDLLVVDPTRSDRDNTDFDTAGMVQRLHASSGSTEGRGKLVVAYIDIGEAEDWRTYWAADWVAPTAGQAGNPDFLITTDPDGWSGNYPVAYWDARWKDIVIYNEDSVLQQVLDDGFDGIYMDWVEAYSNEEVMAAAGDRDPAQEMIAFIREMRTYARAQNPAFLVIPQNAAEILEYGGEEYLAVIDALAQEQVYFDGDADTAWNDANAGDHRVPDGTPNDESGYSRAFYQHWLDQYLAAGKVVLCVDYAAMPGNVAEAYELANARGYIPYVSRRPLDRLTDMPPSDYPE